VRGLIIIENPAGTRFVSLINIIVHGLNKGIVVNRTGGGRPLLVNVKYPDKCGCGYALGVYVLKKAWDEKKDRIGFQFKKIQNDGEPNILDLFGRQMSSGRFCRWRCKFQKMRD